jgi:hypothetical protein
MLAAARDDPPSGRRRAKNSTDWNFRPLRAGPTADRARSPAVAISPAGGGLANTWVAIGALMHGLSPLQGVPR